MKRRKRREREREWTESELDGQWGLTRRRTSGDSRDRTSISWWVLRCISSRKLGSDCGLQSDQSWLLVQPGWLLSVNVTNSWNPEIVWVSYWGMNERRRSGTNGETQLRIPWCLRHPVSTIAPVRVDRLDRYIQSFNVRMRIGYCSLVPPPPQHDRHSLHGRWVMGSRCYICSPFVIIE